MCVGPRQYIRLVRAGHEPDAVPFDRNHGSRPRPRV
jgi:hypothetical protein